MWRRRSPTDPTVLAGRPSYRFKENLELLDAFLRIGMIELEDTHVRERIAIGESIETGAEQHVLPDALRDSLAQLVLGKPAADRQRRTQKLAPPRPISRICFERVGEFFRQDPNGERIFEDKRPILQLMRGATSGDEQ